MKTIDGIVGVYLVKIIDELPGRNLYKTAVIFANLLKQLEFAEHNVISVRRYTATILLRIRVLVVRIQ